MDEFAAIAGAGHDAPAVRRASRQEAMRCSTSLHCAS
jgi:hypothetical protein